MSAVRRPLPEQALLRQLLDYEPDTGTLTWRERPEPMFTRRGRCQWWNGQYANRPAFRTKHGPHLSGSIGHRSYTAHRVIWKLVHGVDPDQIDHINGNGSDNRLSNLRNVSHAENMRNLPLPPHNRSGHAGVSFRDDIGKWCARIRAEGRHLYLGVFETFEEAVVVRQAAERLHGYHPNHGRKAA